MSIHKGPLRTLLFTICMILTMTQVGASSPCDPSPNKTPRSAEYLVQRQYCLFLAHEFYKSNFFQWSRIMYERCNKCMGLRYGIPSLNDEE